MIQRFSLVACLFLGGGLLEAAELKAGDPIPAFAGPARSYLATAKSDYAKESFLAEVSVTLRSGQGGNGCAFIGLGRGQGDAKFYQEPVTPPSLVFRLAASDFAGGQVVATVNGGTAGEPVVLGDGTHRLRLFWDAANRCAWLQIHPNWKAGDTFAAKLALVVPAGDLDFGQEGRLFVGGASGVAFADLSVRPAGTDELKKLQASSFPSSRDPSARTWRPVAEASALPAGTPVTAPVDAFLAPLAVRLRPLACWYRGSALAASRSLPDGSLAVPGSAWTLGVDTREVPGEADARDITLTLTLKEGTSSASGLAAAFDFERWDKDRYVLIPAAVYDGNRIRTVGRGYCAGLDDADYYRKDLPLTQTEVPRLAVEDGKPSKLEVGACNVTTPAICVYDRKGRQGFILLAEQGGRTAAGDFLRKANGEILDNAFAVEENPDRSHATLVVGAPGVRERKPEFIGFSGSPDRGLAMSAGDAVVLRLRAYAFAAPDLPAFLGKFMVVRKALTGPNHPRNLVPASQVETFLAARIDSRYLTCPRGSFYCPENGPWIAFGWIGGWIDTFPMLALGDEQRLERVAKTFDYGFKAQESSGYFRYAIRDDGNVTFREPKPNMNQSRTCGDVLYWMVKQFTLLKAQGRGTAIKPEWEAGIRRLADAFVATWKRDGEWGKMVDVRTGAVSEYNTTGGAPAIGGLAWASQYFGNPEYLEVAKAAAAFYYQRDFAGRGFTTGGCADILQNADSETASALCASLVALHEVTGDPKWLEMAHQSAALVATWTVSHDYELPKSTELGQLDAKLAGVVWASTQNKHGAPGICTNSGDYLLKLYRTTGDARCAELLRDIVHAHAESLRPGGYTNERLTFCDADSRGSRGGHVTGWNETNGILMAQEIPGIYVRTDMDRFYVFDAVEAKVLDRNAAGVKLEIRNPTTFDARVSILAEDAGQAGKPLGLAALVRWPKVPVKAGETVVVGVAPDGRLLPEGR